MNIYIQWSPLVTYSVSTIKLKINGEWLLQFQFYRDNKTKNLG